MHKPFSARSPQPSATGPDAPRDVHAATPAAPTVLEAPAPVENTPAQSARDGGHGVFSIASPRSGASEAIEKPLATAIVSAPVASGEVARIAEEDRAGKRGAGRRGGAVRSVPWEAAAAILFVGATAGGMLALPREAARAHVDVEARRAAEPIVIMPSVPAWAMWEVKSRAAVSFVSMQAPLRRGGVVVGEAPIAGQVSRVRVREGQRVDGGDRILTLATSASPSQAPLPAPRLPNTSRAERRQLQAVRRKEALELRIATAREDYDRAQSRLDRANKRLSEARGLLQRIAGGEAVPDPDAPREPRRRARRARRASASTPARARLEAAQDEKNAALSASSSAEDASRSAQASAKTATYAISSAQSRERSARGEVDSARSKLKSTEAQFEAGTVKADALEEARAGLSQAESALSEASKKVASAQDEARGAQAEAENARQKAAATAERAASALRNLKSQQARVASTSEEAESAPEPEAAASSISGTLSVSAAARLVREAISEAGTAAQNARRLKARVESYKGSATDISQDIQASARSIESAQQQDLEQDLDTTIASNLSSVRAPVAGTVLSVAAVGESVSPGDPIVRIARGPLGLEAKMEDRTEAWKLLRVGMLLPGRLLSPEQAALQAGGANKSTTTGRSPLVGGEPITLKVREVEAPVTSNDAAQIRLGVVPGSGNASARRIVAIALPRGKGALLSIPEGSVARGAGNQPIVGVLREVAPEPVAPSQAQALAPARSDARERMFDIEWRAVGLSDALPSTIPGAPTAPDEVLPGDEKMKKVISGLVPGERILRDAAQWQARLSSTATTPGAPTRVRLDVS